VHGPTLKEFGVEWNFDEFGITPGSQRVHPTLYWFSGDSPVPADPQDLLMNDENWEPAVNDASVTWAGTAGNSVSELRMASSITTTTQCALDPPETIPCEPLLLSDPVNSGLAVWVSLASIGDLTHPAQRSGSRVLKRSDAIAISQIRGEAETDLYVMTDTFTERQALLDVTRSGRVLLLRNPDPRYPESNWYVSIGDIRESRPIPDHRLAERIWQLPIVKVARPTGLIESSGGVTWADVLALGTWSDVLAARDNWLEVLSGGDV
jgi:hypothetical protein